MKVAKKFQDAGKNINFAISGKDAFSHEISEYGITASDEKPVVAARGSKDEKFVMTDEFRLEFSPFILCDH
jgi:hypothetical protein